MNEAAAGQRNRTSRTSYAGRAARAAIIDFRRHLFLRILGTSAVRYRVSHHRHPLSIDPSSKLDELHREIPPLRDDGAHTRGMGVMLRSTPQATTRSQFADHAVFDDDPFWRHFLGREKVRVKLGATRSQIRHRFDVEKQHAGMDTRIVDKDFHRHGAVGGVVGQATDFVPVAEIHR